jgi:HK97 family phage portal protein
MASFLDRIKNSIKAFGQTNTNESYNRFIYNVLGKNTVVGNINDDDFIKRGYAYNPTIYSLINLISKAAITVPYTIYQKVDEQNIKEYKSLTSNSLNSESLLKAKLMRKHIFKEVEHSALGKLLQRPNPTQSWSTFLEELIGFGKLTGNRYVYSIYPDSGENKDLAYQLYNLPAHLIEIKSDGIFKPVSKYTMNYNDSKYDLSAEEVLHIADWNPDYDGSGSHLYGQSPIKAGMRVMTTNNEAVETSLKYLHNQSARGMLTPDDDNLTPTQAQQLKSAFRRNFQGTKSANDIMITGKKFSWVNFGLSSADLQLLESYKASKQDLANLFGVPVLLLTGEHATYDNYKTSRQVLFTNCVIPELNKLRDSLNAFLVPQFGEDLYLDFDYSVIPELMPEQAKLVDQLSKSYWLTTNEKREAVGYGVDEDNIIMNDYLVPSGMIPISDLDLGIDESVTFPTTTPNVEEEVVEEEVIEEIIEEEETKNKKDLSDEVYETEDEAIDRAKQIGCSTTHSHQTEDGEVFMPCGSMDELEDALANENKEELYSNYPKSAIAKAKKAKEINESFGNPCATLVGKNRATDLIEGRGLSLEIVKKTFAYLSRAYEYVSGDYVDEKDKPICGDISFSLWGGDNKVSKIEDDAMYKWCKKILEKNDE